MTETIIAVDIGGTQLRAARYDREARLLARASRPTHADQGVESVLGHLYDTIAEVMPDDPSEVAGIGAIAPGPVNPYEGVIIEAPNIPGWLNLPLRDRLADRFHRPVFLGNDANLAGLAEYRFGAGLGHKNLIYLTVSTGIGAGILVDGRVLLGVHGLAAEVGHMLIDPNGPVCSCGRRGHLEALASGPSLARAARHRLEAGESSSLVDMVGGQVEHIDAVAVGQAAKAGDPLAVDVLRQAGEWIGLGIASLLHLFNPSRIVIGGGVSQTGELLFEPIRDAVSRYSMSPAYLQDLDIVPAALAGDVGLLGGLALVLDEPGMSKPT